LIAICFIGIAECIYSNFILEDNTFLNVTELEYRYVSFDFIKLMISLTAISYLFRTFESLFNDKSSDEKIDLFCQQYGLTPRQKNIVDLILTGSSNKEIGEELHITEGTVKTHIYNIFKKVDVTSRNQIISKIMQSK